MWRNVVVIGLIVALSSCGAKKKRVEASKSPTEIVLGENETVSYKSLGNGVAAISLVLYDNNTFKFDFQSIPQPDTNEKASIISEIGTYKSDGNWKTLKFKKPNFSLASIFDAQFADKSFYEVMDKEHVRINASKEALPIWGVVCERE